MYPCHAASSRSVDTDGCAVPEPRLAAESGGVAAPRLARPRAGERGQAGDFDFLHGQWIVENHVRVVSTAARTGWEAFTSAHVFRPLASCAGHLEEATGDGAELSSTLRLFDAHRGCWTIHAIAAGEGRLEPPLEGGFADGVGVFVGERTSRGAHVLVRHVWTRTARPRCEIASSTDGGRSWRVDTIREFSRVDWPA